MAVVVAGTVVAAVVLLTLTDEDLCGKVEVIAVVAKVHKPQTDDRRRDTQDVAICFECVSTSHPGIHWQPGERCVDPARTIRAER